MNSQFHVHGKSNMVLIRVKEKKSCYCVKCSLKNPIKLRSVKAKKVGNHCPLKVIQLITLPTGTRGKVMRSCGVRACICTRVIMLCSWRLCRLSVSMVTSISEHLSSRMPCSDWTVTRHTFSSSSNSLDTHARTYTRIRRYVRTHAQNMRVR